MKKTLAFLLAAVMIFAVIGCVSQPPATNTTNDGASAPAQEGEQKPAEAAPEAAATIDALDPMELAKSLTSPIKVEIWGKEKTAKENDRGYWANLFCEELNAIYPNVTFEYIYQGGYDDVSQKVHTAAAAGQYPALFTTEESMVKGFADIAEDMRNFVPSAVVNDWIPGLMVSMIGPNGEVLGAPYGRSLPVLVCNETYLEQAGWKAEDIKTNEDMFAAAKAVYEKTGIPGLINYWDTDAWHWESAVYADGGSILSEDGSTPTFGKDYDYVGSVFLKQIQQGLLEGYVHSTYDTPEPDSTRDLMFGNGEVAMMIRSNNGTRSHIENAQSNGFQVKVVLQPAGKGGQYGITSGGSNFVMCKNCSYEEKVFAGVFLSYFYTPENMMRIVHATGMMPCSESAKNSEDGKKYVEENEYMQVVFESQKHLHARPNSPYWTEMYNYAVDKLEQFSLYPDKTDVDSMIDDISTKFAQIIQDNAW